MTATSTPAIGTLFAQDIDRRIEEVIKVDQADQQIILDEIHEYVITKSIRDYYRAILGRYQETPNKPHEGIGVWVSGFFGSGKSSFAKMLGVALADRQLQGQSAAHLFGIQTEDPQIQVLLHEIGERIPTHAVIFDISTDRGIRTGSQTVTEIMYRLFLDSLGYAKDLDLAELEITLEGEGRLAEFEATYASLYGKPWSQQKGLVAIALSQASRVMHELEPQTYPAADSWVQAAKQRADITPGLLAERCKLLMGRKRTNQTLVFVVDEVGQFVARDVQKMLDLQAVVQSLGRVGRGSMWLVVTSQERLNELVGGLDDRRVELARLIDRFPQELQVNLEPSDIAEVTSKRVLAKHADAQKDLRQVFEAHRGALEAHTRLTADIKLPELSADRFIDLYPLLPYQVDLIIQIVSGLRRQGEAVKHVGGANRTIIKLAQQLLINPAVALAQEPVGRLVRLDQIYDLVEGNIGSDIRAKISALPAQVDHPLAQRVAKAICLLQFVKSVHRSAENIAAALYPAVGAESQLPAVKDALAELVRRHQVRQGDDGYRIPTPTEDDWERQRAGLMPKGPDSNRIYADTAAGLWRPQPDHNFLNTKVFKAGLVFQGQTLVEGDIPVHVQLEQTGPLFDALAAELRTRSQVERTAIFWAVPLDDGIDREVLEIYRSQEMLRRKDRGTQTKEEARLVSDESRRQQAHQDNLRRLMRLALLRGSVYFRGNDRSPGESAADIGRVVTDLLRNVLPEVYDRFEEAAAKVQTKDLEALLTAENLQGLTPVFDKLHLLKSQGNKLTLDTNHGPLAEVLARITNRASYGDSATGRYLSEELARAPFGWEFDVVRLLTAALLRAGRLEMTTKGEIVESATIQTARNTFQNNNLFRQASFKPKTTTLEFTDLATAAEAYKTTFGQDVAGLEPDVVARAIRDEITRHEPPIQQMHNRLLSHGLPGADVLGAALDQMRAIRTAKEETAIKSFSAAYASIKEAIRRAVELEETLTDPRLLLIDEARAALARQWPFLRDELDGDPGAAAAAEALQDLLRRETFYREWAAIEQHTACIGQAYARREAEALASRRAAYGHALAQIQAMPAWAQLEPDQQERVARPLERFAADGSAPVPIPQMRADTDACSARHGTAVETMLQLLEGNRLVKVPIARFFQDGIETPEELDAAIEGLRAEVERFLAEGKKVLVQ